MTAMGKETKVGGGQILGKRNLACLKRTRKRTLKSICLNSNEPLIMAEKEKELKINTVKATGFSFIALLHIDHNNLAKLSPNLLKE